MHKHVLRAVMLGAAFSLCGMGMASAATSATPKILAQASPAPAPSATPSPFSYGGFVRGFYFTRQNAAPTLNQASFNAAVALHAAYTFANNWSIGGTYLYANPVNNCTTAADQLQTGGPCSGKKFTGSYPVPTNPDNTLPGFEMSTLYEAYLQYKDPNLYGKIGNQVINTPWANASDSRLKPEAFQGGDISYKFNANWTLEGMFMDRFEDRTDSAFLNSTLLTATNIVDAPGAGGNLLLPKFSAVTNSGMGYGRIGYSGKQLAANLHVYDFTDIALAQWLDAKWTLSDPVSKPFIALQAGNEENTGKGIIGKINSQVVGLQGGITPIPNLDFTIGFDYIPQKSDVFPSGLPAGSPTCSGTTGTAPFNTIGAKGTTPLLYFLPTSGTPNCVVNPSTGAVTVYYGGWASPYTDSYATDQLFTTSISQGLVDRRSPGAATKASLTWYADDRQFRLITSYAIYAYGTNATGVAPTNETDIDGTYFFNKVPKSGPYHGLSLRHRYAERSQAFTQFYGGTADFKYNRTQLEYDF